MAVADEKKRFECNRVHNGREVRKTPPEYGLQPGLHHLRCSQGGTPVERPVFVVESGKMDGDYGPHAGTHELGTAGVCRASDSEVGTPRNAMSEAPIPTAIRVREMGEHGCDQGSNPRAYAGGMLPSCRGRQAAVEGTCFHQRAAEAPEKKPQETMSNNTSPKRDPLHACTHVD